MMAADIVAFPTANIKPVTPHRVRQLRNPFDIVPILDAEAFGEDGVYSDSTAAAWRADLWLDLKLGDIGEAST